jgi:hypothetical protein
MPDPSESPGAEKLVEFGIQPFRGRRKPLPPPAESTAPTEAAPAVD